MSSGNRDPAAIWDMVQAIRAIQQLTEVLVSVSNALALRFTLLEMTVLEVVTDNAKVLLRLHPHESLKDPLHRNDK